LPRSGQVPGEPAEPAQPLQPQRRPDRPGCRIGAGEHPPRQFLRAGVVPGCGRGLGCALQQGDLVDAGGGLRVRQVVPCSDGEVVLGPGLGRGVRGLRQVTSADSGGQRLAVLAGLLPVEGDLHRVADAACGRRRAQFREGGRSAGVQRLPRCGQQPAIHRLLDQRMPEPVLIPARFQ
jgi:hypothetical protein